MGKNNSFMPRKHRHKRHYTFMIIAGDSDGSNKRIHLGHVATQIVAFTLFIILVTIVCYIAFITVRFRRMSSETADANASYSNLVLRQEKQIQELSSANSSLATKNEELQASVDQISKALNIMVSNEEASKALADEAALPKGFHLSGQASYEIKKDDPSSSTKDNAKSGNPIMILKAANGSEVRATGTGTVSSVTNDAKYGKCIMIDHGNGYVSVYRYSGRVLVSEGDHVNRSSALFLVQGADTVLGYQIIKSNNYVNPEKIIEISG